MKVTISWLAGHWSNLRAGLTGVALVVAFSASAVAASQVNLDERLLGYRLDKRLFGHSPEYYCANPTSQPARNLHRSLEGPTPPPPIQVEVIGTNETTAGSPGDKCFRTESEMWTYFGRDPDRPRCVETSPRPSRIEDVVFIPVGEGLSSSDVFCFGEFKELLDHFDLRADQASS